MTDLTDSARRAQLAGLYRDTLLGDVIPFWLRHGMDREHGGIMTALDRDGSSIWWPHCEAIIATLLAWQFTGDAKYARWHALVHDWSFAHFPDREHGEWFGYLHRDGRVSQRAKGNLFKGPFHLPRMLWYCWRALKAEPAP